MKPTKAISTMRSNGILLSRNGRGNSFRWFMYHENKQFSHGGELATRDNKYCYWSLIVPGNWYDKTHTNEIVQFVE